MARKIVMALTQDGASLALPCAQLSCTCRWCYMVSWGRNHTSTAGCRFSPFVWCVRNQHSQKDVSPDSWNVIREKLWREFFSDSSQWLDYRSEKVNRRFADSKHQKTQQGLSIVDNLSPPSVKVEPVTERHFWPDPIFGRKMIREKLWREFFWDPSQWWDNRSEKVNPRYPDFKHKKTQQGLWIIDNMTPPWVEAKLATMATVLVQADVFSWNVRLRRHLASEDYQKTLNLFQQMQLEGMMPNKFTYVPVLNACSNLRSLKEGRRVHEQIIQSGCELDIYVATCLVDMYAKCGSIEDASSVFDRMQKRDVVSWNAMIGGYVKSKQGLKALELFRRMRQERVVEPDAVTFITALNACASIAALEEGRRVHQHIIQRRCQSDIYVATCLVDMYAKCGSIEDAWTVFNNMRGRDVVSWNAMIGGYTKSEQGIKALKLFREMHQEGVEPNVVTFVEVLNACASMAALQEGRLVHEQIVRRGCESDVYVATCLIDMYAKCGSVEDAWSVFNKMRERDVVSWGAMIGSYVRSEQAQKALELFRIMQQEGLEPNAVTFVGVLNACASLAALDEGRRVHEQIIEKGCESVVYIANCLVHMYIKCGSIKDAWSVFNRMPERSVVSWNVLIGGYVKSQQGLKALELFRKMQQEGVEPDAVTFAGALNACASMAALEEGRRVHEQIIQRGFNSNTYITNCLVDMYAKCGSVRDAGSVFNRMRERSVVSWNVMIGAYLKSEQGPKALELFQTMQQIGVEPDAITFVGALNACTSVMALQEGRHVHKQIIRRGCESNVYVATCLVDMYAKCGCIEDAWSVFNKMRERTVVSWTAMIMGYFKSEQGLRALELFPKMQQEGVEPNAVTYAVVLNVCASIAAHKEGRRFHKQIIQRGYESDVYVATCLIDMYAKCGSTKDARGVFDKMRERDVVSWNAMIGGYAMHGHSRKAIELFQRMGKEGVEINQITFICLLSACSHGGFVAEGLRFFNSMTSHYNVLPMREHYGCMVDLLGRAGRLEEAEEKAEQMIERMPMERDSGVWMSLLGACRIHGNIAMAERAANRSRVLDPENLSAHVLLSNVYAAAGKWDRVASIKQERLKRQVWKVLGRTWIVVKNVVHSFVVDDKDHPQLWQIHAELDILSVNMNEGGYRPDRSLLSCEETEECHLCIHSD